MIKKLTILAQYYGGSEQLTVLVGDSDNTHEALEEVIRQLKRDECDYLVGTDEFGKPKMLNLRMVYFLSAIKMEDL